MIAVALCVILQSAARAEPVVIDHEEVAPDYAAARGPTLLLGREVANLFIENEPVELYARFSLPLKSAVPFAVLVSALQEVHSVPIGDLLAEGSLPLSPNLRHYRSEYVRVAGGAQTR